MKLPYNIFLTYLLMLLTNGRTPWGYHQVMPTTPSPSWNFLTFGAFTTTPKSTPGDVFSDVISSDYSFE
jgi:hypothetical protein